MTLDEVREVAGRDNKKNILQFMDDMDEAGIEMRFYKGRFFWSGPAVSCDQLYDIIPLTSVSCQWDRLGKGYIVYPVECL